MRAVERTNSKDPIYCHARKNIGRESITLLPLLPRTTIGLRTQTRIDAQPRLPGTGTDDCCTAALQVYAIAYDHPEKRRKLLI